MTHLFNQRYQYRNIISGFGLPIPAIHKSVYKGSANIIYDKIVPGPETIYSPKPTTFLPSKQLNELNEGTVMFMPISYIRSGPFLPKIYGPLNIKYMKKEIPVNLLKNSDEYRLDFISYLENKIDLSQPAEKFYKNPDNISSSYANWIVRSAFNENDDRKVMDMIGYYIMGID